MQEETTNKTIALSVKTTKMTATVMKAVFKKFLEMTKKQIQKAPKGKQSVKDLVKQNTSLSNIEISDKNIKSFENIAKKYGIDFSLKKDKTEKPPRYLVFFKGKDIDVINQAFKEFTYKQSVKKTSILAFLKASKTQDQNKVQQREKSKDRGMDR